MNQKRVCSLILVLVLIVAVLCPCAAAVEYPAQTEVYQKIIAMKSSYPEGRHWDNSDFYAWKGGGGYYGGYGCAGFAFLLSDAAFGDQPSSTIFDFTYDQVRVGDILRINNDSHSVVILEKYSDHVVLAEGNYNSSIHWGRKLTKEQVLAGDYLMTRYVDVAPDVAPVAGFADVHSDAYYADAVAWAVENNITNGTAPGKFSPNVNCTRAQMVTFLWRAKGSPEPVNSHNPFLDVSETAYYYKAVLWAVREGITNGTSSTTFSPAATVTRAETVTFLWRMEGKPDATSDNPFTDVPSGTFYTDAVLWAVKAEITNGTSKTTFAPSAPCTRGQIVTFLYRDLT